MTLISEILVLVFLLILSGFFSGSEVALISLSKHRVKRMIAEKKVASIFIERLKDDPQRMLATILIGNNLANVGAAALATALMLETFQNYAISIATGVMTLLILVFGEITPKSIAAKNSERISQLVAGPIWYLSIILAPLLNLLDKFLNRFINLFGIKAQENTVTEEEIKSMIKTAEEEGTIKEIEKKMLNRIFSFDDATAIDIATPKMDMVMISINSTVDDALKLIMKKKFSRIPVYEKSKENIVGILYTKDIIQYTKNRSLKIEKIIKKPYMIPETKKISNLLRQFQKRKDHIAIIVDEHGSIRGLVTLEDVLEEIVGEIMDETDKVSPNIKKISKNKWIVSGKTDVDELNEKLKMKVKGDNYDTLSGFILDFTGRIPKEMDVIKFRNFSFTIEEKEGHRISKVKVERH